MVRKVRIGAGNWQALGLARALLHPRCGMRAFSFWGHKPMRWLVPVFVLIALLANIALVRHPLFQIALGLQAAGAVIAVLAYRSPSGESLPKWTRPVSYFYLMNYALLWGLVRFLFGTQRVTWDRAGTAPGVPTTSQRSGADIPTPAMVNESASR
jgi:hypothetical protein